MPSCGACGRSPSPLFRYAPMVDAGVGLGGTRCTVYGLDMPGQGASPPRASPGSPGALAAYPHLALASLDWLAKRGRLGKGERIGRGGGLRAAPTPAPAPCATTLLPFRRLLLWPQWRWAGRRAGQRRAGGRVSSSEYITISV